MNANRTDRLAEIDNFSGTAIAVAEFPVEENSEVQPFPDSVVGLFLNKDNKQTTGSIPPSFQRVKDSVKIRANFLDDILEDQMLSGFRQVVILGAGLNTQAIRKPSVGVTYFEIDYAATLRLKQTCYEEQGINSNVKFIPGNYVKGDLIELLKENDFNFDLPTYFIWKENSMCIPQESSKHIIAQLRQHLRQFRLSFDYMADAVISKPIGNPGITRVVGCFTNMGAPRLSDSRDN